MNKITIIGSGSVGSTIAYTATVMGLASEIVMIDINEEKALGEALDIRQCIPFCNPATVRAGSYQDAVDSDIVTITSGLPRKPGQTRLDLAQANVNIMKSIATEIVKYAPKATLQRTMTLQRLLVIVSTLQHISTSSITLAVLQLRTKHLCRLVFTFALVL